MAGNRYYFEKHVSEVDFTQQRIRKFVGNRFVEAHISGILQDTETELGKIGTFLGSFRSCLI
jgi:hypothetical protein